MAFSEYLNFNTSIKLSKRNVNAKYQFQFKRQLDLEFGFWILDFAPMYFLN